MIVNPQEWISSQWSARHPNRPPLLYVAHPVAAQPGDVVATCTQCGESQLYARGSEVDLRQVCEHDAPVSHSPDAHEIVAFNLRRALRWWRWLSQLEAAVWTMPWYVNVTANGEADPHLIQLGLRDDVEIVRRCDAIMLCGSRISNGMHLEGSEAVKAGLPAFRVAAWPNGEPPTALHPSAVPWRVWAP